MKRRGFLTRLATVPAAALFIKPREATVTKQPFKPRLEEPEWYVILFDDTDQEIWRGSAAVKPISDSRIHLTAVWKNAPTGHTVVRHEVWYGKFRVSRSGGFPTVVTNGGDITFEQDIILN